VDKTGKMRKFLVWILNDSIMKMKGTYFMGNIQIVVLTSF